MQPAGKLRILNNQPTIIISHYDLMAIQHVVDLAPQEAQWFHRVERIEDNGSLYYRIYEMYIPEQWCSGAQVESDPEMFIKLFREMSEKFGPEKTNEILATMNAWCHSHHTMGVNPSGQDLKQFKEQCERAVEDKKTDPQIMLIFNKHNKYYCQLWDPETNLLFENVEIQVQGYDFSEITTQAKTKFKKKPAVTKTKGKGQLSFGWSSAASDRFLDFHSASEEFESAYSGPKKKSPKKKKGGKKGKPYRRMI